MNIFYLGYSLEEGAGGIENYSLSILNHLKAKGHNVYVSTVNGRSSTFPNIDLKRIKFIDKFIYGYRISIKLKRCNMKIDLFLCGHLFLSSYMEQIVRFHKSKYFLFVYGIEVWGLRFKKRQKRLKNLNKVISISSFTTEQIRKQGYDQEIIYVPPVLDVEKTKNSFQVVSNDNRICFLTVGRLSSVERYKGHDQVIEAVNILKKKALKILSIK